tara:strand:+ start:123 stop:329 length:207 start_codon:yes stop_codon:yes gene_type:complete
MARRQNEIGTGAVARILGIHRNTALNWARKAIAGDRSYFTKVRRDLTGHYWFDRDEVHAIKNMNMDYN